MVQEKTLKIIPYIENITMTVYKFSSKEEAISFFEEKDFYYDNIVEIDEWCGSDTWYTVMTYRSSCATRCCVEEIAKLVSIDTYFHDLESKIYDLEKKIIYLNNQKNLIKKELNLKEQDD